MTRRSLGIVRYQELRNFPITCDLHIHTSRTDGTEHAGSIMRRAVDVGLSRIAFTEHVRRDSDWFDDFVDEVRLSAENFPGLEVLVGCETKALDCHGTLDVSDRILNRCDIVLGSVHRFPDGHGGFRSMEGLDPHTFAALECELANGLLENAQIDVLAHPGGMFARRFKTDLPGPAMKGVMVRARERGVAVEINSSYLVEPAAFLALCAEVNPLVSVGSDMHTLEQLGACRDLLMGRGGVTR